MKNQLLLLALFQTITFSQILLPSNLSLLSATDASLSNDPKLARAALYILQSHPELENATVLEVNANAGENGTINADYFITLRNTNSTLLVAVTISPNTSEFFVSFLNLAPAMQQTTPNKPPPTFGLATNNITQTSQATLAVQNQSQSAPPPLPRGSYLNLLGGFRIMDNLNDSRFRTAMDYLKSIRPNIANYQVSQVQYQVISGITFLIRLSGYDQLTAVLTKITVDLAGVARILDFTVLCAPQPSFDCNDKAASSIYFGTELAINTHRQLTTYKLDSIYIEQQSGSHLSFMATFQNDSLQLRAIAELQTSPKSLTVQAFYTYHYQ